MKRIAFTRSTEIQNTAPYLPDLDLFFKNHEITAKLFYARGQCNEGDFPGEAERIEEDISATALAEKLIAWKPDAVVSLAIPEDNVVRDAIVGEILSRQRIPMVVHPVSAAQVFSNKWETKVALERFGLKAPAAFYIDGDLLNRRNLSFPAYPDLVLLNGQRIGYPLLTKPLWDCSGNGIVFHRDSEELDSFLSSPYNGNVILEKFLRGHHYGIEIIGTGGDYIFQPMLSKGLTKLEPYLFFNEVRHSVIDRVAERIISNVKEKLIAFCNYFRINGVIQVEMIFHEGEYYIIEINPRVSGVTVLSSASSGINTFEALTHMAIGSWPEFQSKFVAHLEPDTFALQFPYVERHNFDFRDDGVSVIITNDFYRPGRVYKNAIVSAHYKKISDLGRDINSIFHLSDGVSESIENIARTGWEALHSGSALHPSPHS